jgi:hypothetical protein
MSRILIGDTVSTSYGTGPYSVMKVVEKCTCPSFTQSLNDEGEFKDHSPEHCHLELKNPEGGNSYFYVSGYSNTLKSVWSNDFIIKHELNFLLLTGILL